MDMKEDSQVLFIPQTPDEAAAMKQRLGQDACFVAAGTFLQLQWNERKSHPRFIISLEQIKELQGLQLYDGYLEIGSLTHLAEMKKTLSSEGDSILAEAITQIASPAIRNQATIGGNIMSKKGDLIPLLLALDAEIAFLTDSGTFRQSLLSWIKQKEESLLLTHVYIPHISISRLEEVSHTFFRKIGRRESFIPSLATICGSFSRDIEGRIIHMRLAVGGGDHPAERLFNTEKHVIGRKINEDLLEQVYQSIIEEFTPEKNPFASAEYLQMAAANLAAAELQSFCLEKTI
ncbi:FAD binding domain-containing protein [Peribacillus kribbensis]|uniref:FAD binding domain-containing protein n=1 Tax=Peribacillus kribbensis TaxID=356658 RepID=UPI000404C775|nr:FAD binding domain-containing protein [Peribacillus kribbensis]